jgi:hypothetical protein
MKELLFRLTPARGSKAINALLLVGLAVWLCACATTIPPQKATIGTDSIKNPSVGYKGYTLPIPPGYKVATPENLPAGLDPRIRWIVTKWEKELGPGNLVERFNFTERVVIYNDKSAFLFGVSCYSGLGSFSTCSDLDINNLLGGRLRGWFRNDRTIDRKAVLTENRKRALYYGGIDAYGKANYDSIETYIIIGGLNEFYSVIGIANHSYREELRRVGRELYDTLEFSR